MFICNNYILSRMSYLQSFSYSVPVPLSLSELEVSLQLLSHSGKGSRVYLTDLHFPFPTFHPLLMGDGCSLSSKCLKQWVR